MPNYRRVYINGGCYYFTVCLADRQASLLTDNIAALRAAFKYTASRHPFEINAICILPDHLHCIWTLPENSADFSMRWRLIKSHFSRAMRRKGIDVPIWQNRFWEQVIEGDRQYDLAEDYIYDNPRKHGYVERIEDWPYSSWYKLPNQTQTGLF